MYATAGGDSVYAFNRLLRAATSAIYLRGLVKSRDNLFDALATGAGQLHAGSPGVIQWVNGREPGAIPTGSRGQH